MALPHRRSLVLAALLLAGAGAAAPALADPLSSFAGRRGGDGKLEGYNGSTQLVEAEVRLRAGGDAEIVLRDRRSEFRLTGTWRKDPGDYVKLAVTGLVDRAASASGWVLVRGGTFEEIEIDGRSGGDRKLSVSFKASGPERPVAPDWPGIDTTLSGYGQLERPLAKQDVDQLRVELRPDGTAIVSLSAPMPTRIAGAWSDRRPDSVRIEVREALGDSRATGTGTLRLGRGGVEQLELTGETARGRFRLDFRTGATAPRPAGRPASFTAEYGSDQPGGDFQDLYAGDLDQCQDACAREERCRAYTYNTRDHRCYLKDSERPMIRRSDTVTGVKRGRSGLSERPGFNLEGGDYSRVYLDTLEQCQEACRRDRTCLAYTYNTVDRMCYLKDRVGSYTPRRDTVSGEKGGGR